MAGFGGIMLFARSHFIPGPRADAGVLNGRAPDVVLNC